MDVYDISNGGVDILEDERVSRIHQTSEVNNTFKSINGNMFIVE